MFNLRSCFFNKEYSKNANIYKNQSFRYFEVKKNNFAKINQIHKIDYIYVYAFPKSY